ncbi:uncharacterized protein LOC121257847 [Juglans microcarpa x Juglans regia]|uniref:uncharacterized protein LOC121257847 n=1 Tax=Juglans microcarpa x Juglans regia TaxID=2249226 RepID=UPI001B7E4A42|nr:uncharacterized protein LOC121257847 [Juglans microcarpa x Juglans regia]
MTNFLVIEAPSSYNDILGCPTLNSLKAVMSYLEMKFPADLGVGEVRGEQVLDRECYNLELRHEVKVVATVERTEEALKPVAQKVKQKRQSFSAWKYGTIVKEVDCLQMARFIKEVYYPEWLSNVVLVKNAKEKWQMCANFIDLNKACPKDSFPLPCINLIVDSTTGHPFLSFMDAYSGYNQIRINLDDEEKTSFVTDRGLYYYKAMSFGLKNVGATYQRLVN